MPTAVEISAEIEARMWSASPIDLREACSVAIHASDPSVPLRVVDDLAENVEDSVFDQLNEYLDDCATRGVVPSFRWGSVDPRRLVGFLTYRRTLPSEVGERVPLAPRMLSALSGDLTPAEFEGICARLLAQLGCTKFKATPPSHDGGIDFVGLSPFDRQVPSHPVLVRPRVLGRSGFVILGQAKQLAPSGRVHVEQVRSFYGSSLIAGRMSEAGESVSSTDVLLNSMGFRAAQPLVLLFVTTGEFSRDAKKLCDRLGIITVDGVQLSQALAIEGVAIRFDSGNFEFNPNLLREWAQGLDPAL